jgi:hypothetical protein
MELLRRYDVITKHFQGIRVLNINPFARKSRKSNVFLILTPGAGLEMACPIYADG